MTTQSHRPTTCRVPDLYGRGGGAGVADRPHQGLRAGSPLVATDGAEGVPALRIDGLVRVPRYGVEELVGGLITWPIPGEPIAVTPPVPPAPIDIRSRSNRRRAAASSQQSLPLPS